MKWTKEDNIKNAGKWLCRQIELIDEKHILLEKQKLLINTNNGKYVAIKNIFRGGVYWAELGEGNIGGEKNKTRPVLVMSPNNMNKGNTVIIVPISTKFDKKPNGLPKYDNHYLLKKKDYPLLDEDSVVKFEDIRSIDVVRLRDAIFNVKSEEMKNMKKNLLFMFGY